MKMRKGGGAVALVDGYSRANAYGAEATGSTVIMVEAAKGVRKQGDDATVYACEQDSGRYKAMCSKLDEEISTGLLKAYNEPHEKAFPNMQRELGSKPAVDFLDPQTVTQMTEYDSWLVVIGV